jgi:methionyl-tRNA formyltransferase
MNLIFAGTPKFALPALEALLASKHKVIAVYTQPDRPQGRGLKITPSPIKQLAVTYGLPLYQPKTLRDPSALQQLQTLKPDIFIDVAYGLFIPEEMLNTPRYGCINLHPSLLPRWRGASPIQAAILAGDKITGASIIKLSQELDAGDILKQREEPIEDQDTTATLSNNLAILGAELLLETLDEIAAGAVKSVPQDNSFSTYAHKINKEDAKINWHLSALELERQIRAFNPWPIAYTTIGDETVRIWEAQILPHIAGIPGTIINVAKIGIDVATKDGILRLTKLQLPGKKVLPISEILNSQQKLFVTKKCFV